MVTCDNVIDVRYNVHSIPTGIETTQEADDDDDDDDETGRNGTCIIDDHLICRYHEFPPSLSLSLSLSLSMASLGGRPPG